MALVEEGKFVCSFQANVTLKWRSVWVKQKHCEHVDCPHLWSCRYSLGLFRRCRNRSTILFLPTPYGRKNKTFSNQAKLKEWIFMYQLCFSSRGCRQEIKRCVFPLWGGSADRESQQCPWVWTVLCSDRGWSLRLTLASCLSWMAAESLGPFVRPPVSRCDSS